MNGYQPSLGRSRAGPVEYMGKWPSSIVIVGGGTAGWLAALMLGDAAKRQRCRCEITVVESSRIGTVGVGEGSTAVFRQMLQYLGIDEFEFMRETDATIKLGIRHRDWRRLGHHYDGPIDDPHRVAGGPAGVPYLDMLAVGRGRSVTDSHLFQQLMDKQCSPFAMSKQGVGAADSRPGAAKNQFVALGPFHHAYHFDQAKAGQYLRLQAGGVTVIDDQVVATNRDAQSGDVVSLRLACGQTLSADLYLDCTGFRRALINQMGARWQSYANVLPVNRAMPFWLDIAADEEIAPYTLASAQKAGWLWMIPTRTRYGCGYVYADQHISPEQAQAEIEATLGRPVEPRNDISIDSGRLDDVWLHNVVALGLSSSFLEPLEATSIHGTVVQLMLLVQQLEQMAAGRQQLPAARERYNRVVGKQVDDFRDFIRLHYVSERRDSPFWRELANTHPSAIEMQLRLWQHKVPGPEDFGALAGGLPHVDHSLYTPVLDGLGLLNRQAATAQLQARKGLRQQARKTSDSLIQEYRRASGQAVGHRAFLELLQQDFKP